MAESAAPPRLALDEPPPPNYTWNARAIIVDSALFGIGLSFISPNTVLPAFISLLTDSGFAVGLASATISGAWLLPQLVVASAVARLPRKLPLIMRAAWISRLIFLVTAFIILRFAQTRPMLTLAVLLVSVALFYALDAVVSVPWFDLLAKVIPSRRRGRVLGASQVLGGLASIGVGAIVRYVLSSASPWAFPLNYALLFTSASLMLLGGAAALSCMREPEASAAARAVPTMRQVLATSPRILAQDRPFRRLIGVRLLAGFVGMANAFYVLYATRKLGLGLDVTGLFVSAQVAGSLTAGLLMSTLQDRWGPLIHLRTALSASLIPPLVALGVGAAAGVLGRNVLYPYLLVYFFLGLYNSSFGWPYFNWILEYAPEGQRPLYIGMINTLGAATMLAPMLGGWIVGAISYPAAFALAMLCAGAALALSLPLPSTRH